MARFESLVIAIALMLVLMLGCTKQVDRANSDAETPAFALPSGDIALGQAAFVRMRCYDCHDIGGVDLPVGEEFGQVRVALGGPTSKAVNYTELITSIINPSHKLSPSYAEALIANGGVSNMTNYNDAMTVSELIDLVAFLESKYEVIEAPARIEYPIY